MGGSAGHNPFGIFGLEAVGASCSATRGRRARFPGRNRCEVLPSRRLIPPFSQGVRFFTRVFCVLDHTNSI